MSLTSSSYIYIFASIQLVKVVIGIALNLIIIHSFIRRRLVRKKIPNILLFNQAIADLFNGVVYGVSYVTYTLLIEFKDENAEDTSPFVRFFRSTTLFSSILLYAVIALERFLAITYPLRHRVHVRKKHIWLAVVISWLITTIVSVLNILFESMVRFTIMSLIILINIILFVATFIKAKYSTHLQAGESNQLNINFKKQLRLTMVFFAMFMAFTIVYIPLLTCSLLGVLKHEVSIIWYEAINSLLLLTSVLNPILTITFKKELRPCMGNRESNSNRSSIEIQTIQPST